MFRREPVPFVEDRGFAAAGGGVRGGGDEDEGDGHLKRMLGVPAWLDMVTLSPMLPS